MTASKLKGSLLEYIVRSLLSNCGFLKVDVEEPFIFKKQGLTLINGKGAAHDADVLMTPPIQMPFSYPYRLNFECKAYAKKTGLTIIRNALGLRYDINDFEIVTKDFIDSRKNNRRSALAIDERARFNYQVGVASVQDFTKDAFEFAANNKIPLISLSWFLPNAVCDLFTSISDDYLRNFSHGELESLHQFLKEKDSNMAPPFLLNVDSHFKTIFDSFRNFENRVLIGLLETGDMLFLVSETDIDNFFFTDNRRGALSARFYYERPSEGIEGLDFWDIEISQTIRLRFYLPTRIVKIWQNQGYGAKAALNIKEQLFSKIFIFVQNRELPFVVVKIDRDWYDSVSD